MTKKIIYLVFVLILISVVSAMNFIPPNNLDFTYNPWSLKNQYVRSGNFSGENLIADNFIGNATLNYLNLTGDVVFYGNVTMLPLGMWFTAFNATYTYFIYPYWVSPYNYTKSAYWGYPSSSFEINDDLEVSNDVNVGNDLIVSDHISCNGIEPAWIHIGGVPSGGFYVDTWNANFSVPVEIFGNLTAYNITAENIFANNLSGYLDSSYIVNTPAECSPGYAMSRYNGSTSTCVALGGGGGGDSVWVNNSGTAELGEGMINLSLDLGSYTLQITGDSDFVYLRLPAWDSDFGIRMNNTVIEMGNWSIS